MPEYYKKPAHKIIQNQTPMKTSIPKPIHKTPPPTQNHYPGHKVTTPINISKNLTGNFGSNSKILSTNRSNHFVQSQRSLSPFPNQSLQGSLLVMSNRQLPKTPIKTPAKIFKGKVYTSGSQHTTPLKVEFQGHKVKSYTPMRPKTLKNSQSKGSLYASDLEKTPSKFVGGGQGFDIGKFLGHRNSEKLHIKISGIEKVDLSNDENYLIFGGDGLHVLDMSNEKFKLIRFDKKKSNFPL